MKVPRNALASQYVISLFLALLVKFWYIAAGVGLLLGSMFAITIHQIILSISEEA